MSVTVSEKDHLINRYAHKDATNREKMPKMSVPIKFEPFGRTQSLAKDVTSEHVKFDTL